MAGGQQSSPVPRVCRGRAGTCGADVASLAVIDSTGARSALPLFGVNLGSVFWAEGAETAGASAQCAGRVWSCQVTVLGWAASPFWGNLG